MPPRSPGAPGNYIDLYRSRLNAEMESRGVTDRDLVKMLAKRGLRLPHTSIYKTRKGTRQPTLDECMRVADAFDYERLDDFLIGPETTRVARAVNDVRTQAMLFAMSGAPIKNAMALLDVTVHNEETAAAMDAQEPGWRQAMRRSLRAELEWFARDTAHMWAATLDRVDEILSEGDDNA